MTQRDLALYEAELEELDLQITIMKEKKAEIARERDQLLPNGLDMLMSSKEQKTTKKRKAGAIVDHQTFYELEKILAQNKSEKLQENDDEKILDALSAEEKSSFKKKKLTREVYSEETKKITIELTSKYL